MFHLEDSFLNIVLCERCGKKVILLNRYLLNIFPLGFIMSEVSFLRGPKEIFIIFCYIAF